MRTLIPDQSAGSELEALGPTQGELRSFAGLLLARREYAVQELQARLLKKWAEHEDIESRVSACVADLQEEGALSDERFTASFIRSRCLRSQGPLKIEADLRQRRVPEPVIESQLQNCEEEWIPLATRWLARQHSGALDFAGRAKYYRRLINRGFSHQQAMAALQSFSEQ